MSYFTNHVNERIKDHVETKRSELALWTGTHPLSLNLASPVHSVTLQGQLRDIVSNIPVFHEGETMNSYIRRLADINALDPDFIRQSAANGQIIPSQTSTAKATMLFSRNISIDGCEPVFMLTPILGLRAFLSNAAQAQIISLLTNQEDRRINWRYHLPDMTDCECPACHALMEKARQQPRLLMEHHLPGIRVCPYHGMILIHPVSRLEHFAPSIAHSANIHSDCVVRITKEMYSVFMTELFRKMIPCSLEALRDAVIRRISLLLKDSVTFETLIPRVSQSSLLGPYFKREAGLLNVFRNRPFVKSVDIPLLTELLIDLFGTPESFLTELRKEMPVISKRKLHKKTKDHVIIEKIYDGTFARIRCLQCGEESFTTVSSLLDEFVCPACGSTYPSTDDTHPEYRQHEQLLIKSIADNTGNVFSDNELMKMLCDDDSGALIQKWKSEKIVLPLIGDLYCFNAYEKPSSETVMNRILTELRDMGKVIPLGCDLLFQLGIASSSLKTLHAFAFFNSDANLKDFRHWKISVIHGIRCCLVPTPPLENGESWIVRALLLTRSLNVPFGYRTRWTQAMKKKLKAVLKERSASIPCPEKMSNEKLKNAAKWLKDLMEA